MFSQSRFTIWGSIYTYMFFFVTGFINAKEEKKVYSIPRSDWFLRARLIEWIANLYL